MCGVKYTQPYKGLRAGASGALSAAEEGGGGIFIQQCAQGGAGHGRRQRHWEKWGVLLHVDKLQRIKKSD